MIVYGKKKGGKEGRLQVTRRPSLGTKPQRAATLSRP